MSDTTTLQQIDPPTAFRKPKDFMLKEYREKFPYLFTVIRGLDDGDSSESAGLSAGLQIIFEKFGKDNPALFLGRDKWGQSVIQFDQLLIDSEISDQIGELFPKLNTNSPFELGVVVGFGAAGLINPAWADAGEEDESDDSEEGSEDVVEEEGEEPPEVVRESAPANDFSHIRNMMMELQSALASTPRLTIEGSDLMLSVDLAGACSLNELVELGKKLDKIMPGCAPEINWSDSVLQIRL